MDVKVALRVVAAAVKDVDGQVFQLPPPARHHDVLHMMHVQGRPQVEGQEQGFVLSDGRFARRKPAKLVADAAGQTKPRKPDGYNGPDLYSEDVW